MTDKTSDSSAIVNSANQPFFEHLIRIASLYAKSGDKRKSNTFYGIATKVKSLTDDVTVADYDITQHGGIGGSTQKELEQLLERGTTDRLQTMLSDPKTPLESPIDRVYSLMVTRNPGSTIEQFKNQLILSAAVGGFLSTPESLLESKDKLPADLVSAGLVEVLEEVLK